MVATPRRAPTRWHLRDKLAEWGRRYLPAEVVGIICALVGGIVASRMLGNPALTALAGTWGETVGYYATMLVTELRQRGAPAGRIALRNVPRAIRDLLLEFSGAECLDSLFIRPAAMYALAAWSGNLVVGLLLGKLVADIAFYIPTIVSYELRRKYLMD
jgi:hypothetical protein